MKRTEGVRCLEAAGCRVQEQVPLATQTTFRIGGAADYLVTVSTCEQAAAVCRFCREEEVPLLVWGNGSNLLVSDAGVAGIVLRTAPENGTTVAGTQVTAAAGVPLSRLCRLTADAGLSGLEFAFGIPGTVGGGTYMNAGAYGGELGSVIDEVTALTPEGESVTLSGDALSFGYRHSVFQEQPLLVWSVTMTLRPGDPEAIRAAMAGYQERRRAKQPLEYPSAGSFFKRPAGHFAGALIEQCGLKGLRVGGAEVSEKHAGFLINRGGATCADVLALACTVQKRVREQCGVQLEREVRLVGRQEEQ